MSQLSRNDSIPEKGGTGNLPVLLGYQPNRTARTSRTVWCGRTPLPFRAAGCRTAQPSWLCYPKPTASCRLGYFFLIAALVAIAFTGSVLAVDLTRTSDHDYDPPQPGSYSLPVVKRAADGEVLDSQGRPLRLRDLTHGRVTVMSFIYTRCAAPKACPMATGVLMQLHHLSAEDAALAKNLRLISMSFDPGNDTPERMAAYSALAGKGKTAAEWRFITTASQDKLQPILDAYGQAVDRKKNPNDPTGPLNHSLRVFLIDRDGNIRNIYSSGTLDLRLVLADVKTMAMESAQPDKKPVTHAPRRVQDPISP
jgi:cytochrome oxidase Cu insertion factor (SCO1/SenC/PrrC family)